MLLFSKGTNAKKMSEKVRVPWLTAKIDLIGLSTNAMEIMIVQMLILVPVIQNIKSVMRICFEGDFANSQAFYSLCHSISLLSQGHQPKFDSSSHSRS